MWLVTGMYYRGRIGADLPFILPFSISHPAKVSAFVSATIMAPQLDAARHILIETLLKKGGGGGVETKYSDDFI